MKPIVEIKDLNKTYSKSVNSAAKKALSDINLEIPKGSFFGLLGPNGAGKSTIINILAGLVNKSSGTVKIAGIDIDQDQKATKYKIGIVPQELVLDPFFTVRETLEIYAGYYGIKKNDRQTDQIIKALGLKDKVASKSRGLSGGMKRRLLVGKALVHKPDILVLDEPTAGVDVELRNQLWEYVRKLNKSGTTILLTTHYLEEAEQLCDQIAIINNGKVIANDRKENLMNILSRKALIINFESKTKPAKNLIEGAHLNIVDDNKLSITYDPTKLEVEKILKILIKNDISIKDISTQQPDLEEVFKYLLKKK